MHIQINKNIRSKTLRKTWFQSCALNGLVKYSSKILRCFKFIVFFNSLPVIIWSLRESSILKVQSFKKTNKFQLALKKNMWEYFFPHDGPRWEFYICRPTQQVTLCVCLYKCKAIPRPITNHISTKWTVKNGVWVSYL